MAVRFIIEDEASITRPDWDGKKLCLQWGSLTDEEGRVAEKGYRNIWRDQNDRLLAGRAQTLIPSRAMSEELWKIAEGEGWSDLLSNAADQWMRVRFDRDNNLFSLEVSALMNSVFKTIAATGHNPSGEIFTNNTHQFELPPLGERIYYFSPKAVALVKDELSKYSPEPCPPPNFSAVRPI
jgi:hypothetical protein